MTNQKRTATYFILTLYVSVLLIDEEASVRTLGVGSNVPRDPDI